MGFRNGAYATIWETKAGKGNYTDARISISKKDKNTDKYETDFSGFVRLIGNAHKDAGLLKEKDRIKIGECEVTNSYDKEKKVTYTNYAIFSFEIANNNNSNQTSNTQSNGDFMNIPDGIEEELPFA